MDQNIIEPSDFDALMRHIDHEFPETHRKRKASNHDVLFYALRVLKYGLHGRMCTYVCTCVLCVCVCVVRTHIHKNYSHGIIGASDGSSCEDDAELPNARGNTSIGFAHP